MVNDEQRDNESGAHQDSSSPAETASMNACFLSTPSGAHAQDAEAASSVLSSRYEVIEAHSRGGMGVVYRARHRALGMQVAIKVMHRGSVLRLCC